jgi:hypothetical protein
MKDFGSRVGEWMKWVRKSGSRFRFIVGSVRCAQWCLQPEGPRCSRNHVRLDHNEVEHSSS